jgi:hypothetical protein
MRKLSLALFALAIAAATAGVAFAASSTGSMSSMGSHPNNVFHFNPMTKSGQQGTVTITPMGADKTKVVISLTGAPVGAIEPAHIHKGQCDISDPGHFGPVVIPLTDVVAGHSMTIVNEPISKVAVTGDSVNVHKSAAQINQVEACANVKNIP